MLGRYFALLIGITILLSGCQTFICRDSHYTTRLNDALEQDRRQKIRIEQLQRENQYLSGRNLDLGKEKRMLELSLQDTTEKFQNLQSQKRKDDQANEQKIKALSDEVDILKQNEKTKTSNLINLHRQTLAAIQKKHNQDIEEWERRWKEVRASLQFKEKQWTQQDYEQRKQIQDLGNDKENLEKQLAASTKKQRDTLKAILNIFDQIDDTYKVEVKSGIIVLQREAGYILIPNKYIFQERMIEWSEKGESRLIGILNEIISHPDFTGQLRLGLAISPAKSWMQKIPKRISIPIGPPHPDSLNPKVPELALKNQLFQFDTYPYVFSQALLRLWLVQDSLEKQKKLLTGISFLTAQPDVAVPNADSIILRLLPLP